MKEQTGLISMAKPYTLMVGPTVTRYNFNIRETTVKDEDGKDVKAWIFDCYAFDDGEYNMIQNGIMVEGGQWTAELHRIFREYQHRRTDDLYAYANRMFRITQDAKYTSYIASLDSWNASVSLLAQTMSLDVPDLPVQP